MRAAEDLKKVGDVWGGVGFTIREEARAILRHRKKELKRADWLFSVSRSAYEGEVNVHLFVDCTSHRATRLFTIELAVSKFVRATARSTHHRRFN